MNQKCFWTTGTVVEVSDYINELIKNGWKIISTTNMDRGVIIVAENPASAPLNLTFNKK